MTSEEIRAAIERLRKISYGARKYNALEVVEAIIPDGSWVDGLIGLLKQADPDTRMILPVDADGERIHLGDELCGYGCPDGGVYCQAIVNESIILVGETSIVYKDWILWDTADCRHRHKPTVEDVLREFGDEVRRCCDTEDTIAEYAAKLREVMADDDHR